MIDRNRNQVTRRELLRSTVVGAAAGGLGPLAAGVWAAESATSRPAIPGLPAGVLGRTKYPVTRISFGAIRISDRLGTRILKAAIDAGINLVHTAANYVGGKSMRAVGDLFKADRSYRDKVFLCVKSYHPENEGEIDGLLEKLNTDHADVQLTELHEADRKRMERILATQMELKRQGKIRHTGFVCHGDMNAVIEMVLKHAPTAFDVALVSTAMLPTSRDRTGKSGTTEMRARFLENLRALRARDVGILSMKSGAKDALEKGAAVFQPHAKAVLEAGADSVLTSISTVDQVALIRSLDLRLPSPAPAGRRAAAFDAERSGACLMCASCRRACPQGVPVNDLMRIRMYHDEYGWPDHALSEFRAIVPDARSLAARCTGCSACAAACPAGCASAAAVQRIAAMFA